MTARELLTARDKLARQIAELDRVINEVATSGFSSASVSSGGGSQSYTRASLGELRAMRSDYVDRLNGVLVRLGGSPSGIRRVQVVRC